MADGSRGCFRSKTSTMAVQVNKRWGGSGALNREVFLKKCRLPLIMNFFDPKIVSVSSISVINLKTRKIGPLERTILRSINQY